MAKKSDFWEINSQFRKKRPNLHFSSSQACGGNKLPYYLYTLELKRSRNLFSNLSNMANYTCIYTSLYFISLFHSIWSVNRLFINARDESKPVHQHVLISKGIIWDYSSCGHRSVLCVCACVSFFCVSVEMRPCMYKYTHVHGTRAVVGMLECGRSMNQSSRLWLVGFWSKPLCCRI